MPVLFLHGVFDYVCETIDSQLATPMWASCSNLTEATIPSGHWMAQGKASRGELSACQVACHAVSFAMGSAAFA
jgi:hypothetical protein